MVVAATSAVLLLVAALSSLEQYEVMIAVGGIALGLCLVTIKAERLALLWFALTPIASYYFRYPAQKSIVTFDRVSISLIVIALIFRAVSSKRKLPTISLFEIFWGLFTVVALVSVARMSFDPEYSAGYALRTAVDGFLLPLALFFVTKNYFDSRAHSKSLMLASSLVGIYLFVLGLYEFIFEEDLFPIKDAAFIREGFVRANGPFTTDNSYAIICLLLFFLIYFLPRLGEFQLDRASETLRRITLAMIGAATLIPLFRVIIIALIVGLLLPLAIAYGRKWVITFLGVVFALGAIILLPVAGLLTATDIFQDRVANPDNIYGRMATYIAALKIAADSPITGIGLENYTPYFLEKFYGKDSEPDAEVTVEGVVAIENPHSNIFAVLSELGLIGLLLYLAANIYLLKIGISLIKSATTKAQHWIGVCFVVLYLAYWIPGLTLTSGYYSDLNLYFFFLLGFLINRARAQAPSAQRPMSDVLPAAVNIGHRT